MKIRNAKRWISFLLGIPLVCGLGSAGSPVFAETDDPKAKQVAEKQFPWLGSMDVEKFRSYVLKAGYILDDHYLFPKKRDPFIPLVVEDKVLKRFKGEQPGRKIVRKAKKKKGRKKFGKELKELKTIPFELYRRIKDIDSGMYHELERLARLFRERTELQAMRFKNYMKVVEDYKKLIQKANNASKRVFKTPLQIKYSSLNFSGIVWGELESVALIETPDSKGYAVRTGSFVGPNFGVVEQIQKSQVILVERYRNYLGEIISKTKEVKLKKGFKDLNKEQT